MTDSITIEKIQKARDILMNAKIPKITIYDNCRGCWEFLPLEKMKLNAEYIPYCGYCS